MMAFFRKKKREEPDELRRIRGELRLPEPENVSEEELGEPIVKRHGSEETKNFDINIPRKRSGFPPDLEPLIGPPLEKKGKEEEKEDVNKLDLILSKLETIDARLRLIEEKLKKF